MYRTDSVFYAELAPLEFQERLAACPVAYLPLGTLEWHGPQLPLGTDLLEGHALFTLAAKQFGGIVMPGLFVGPDRHVRKDGVDYYGMDVYIDVARSPAYYPLQQLPGSAYRIPDDLFDRLLESIISQLARAGFRVVVGYGHTPSNDRFLALADRMWDLYRVRLIMPDSGSEDYAYIEDHGSKSETSNIMYFYPELVHMDRLPADSCEFAPGMGGMDPRGSACPEYTGKKLPAILEHLGKCIREALENCQ